MISTDLARKIIEIIDAYGDDKISTINVIEKYCMQKVQEKEIVCNTLENEITNYCKSHFKSDNDPNEWKESGIAFSAGQLVNFASHFANWQKQKDKEQILILKDQIESCYAAMKCKDELMEIKLHEQKEEMMKDAVDAKVIARWPLRSAPLYNSYEMYVPYAQHLSEGEKVKLIIIKED